MEEFEDESIVGESYKRGVESKGVIGDGLERSAVDILSEK